MIFEILYFTTFFSIFSVAIVLFYIEKCIEFYANLCWQDPKNFLIEILELIINYLKNNSICDILSVQIIDDVKTIIFTCMVFFILINTYLSEIYHAEDYEI